MTQAAHKFNFVKMFRTANSAPSLLFTSFLGTGQLAYTECVSSQESYP